MEKRKTTNKKTKKSKTSSLNKKRVVTTLSNEELLDAILEKKKKKKKVVEDKKLLMSMSLDELSKLSDEDIVKSVNDEILNKTVSKGESKSKVDLSSLSNDELFDYIMIKKKCRQVKKIKSNNDDLDKPEFVKRHEKMENDYQDALDKKIENTFDVTETQEQDFSKEVKEKTIFEKAKSKNKIEIFTKENLPLYLVFVLIVILAITLYFGFKVSNSRLNSTDEQESTSEEVVIDERPQLYEECLNRALSEDDESAYLKSVEKELTEYLDDNYNASVLYYDLTFGYSFKYNSSTVYYAASTIKALDALYIYTKAANGEINLDDTITYTKKFKRSNSSYMSKHSYGDKIKIRDLVKYAVMVSDNSAHQMLVDYIGYSNLKEFGKSLGAEYTLEGSDNFGNIDINDGYIYMKAIYEFVLNNSELGSELLEYFVNSNQNDVALSEYDIKAATKYGEYSNYYHNISIVYDENPYILIVLTTEKSGDFEDKIHDISLQVYNLHNSFYQNRKDICQIEVYEE